MQHFCTDALILRSVDRGDHDKLLTVLAADYGRFYAILKGAHSVHRREVAATEPYTWSNMEFYEKNGVKWVKGATVNEIFPGIRYDVDKLFLSAYVAEVVTELSDEREPADEILSLALNTLHMLSVTKGENARIKATFEMRAAAISGFYPELSLCGRCGGDFSEGGYLDVMNGALVCRSCMRRAEALTPLPEINEQGERTVLSPLSPSAAAALRYVVEAEPKRVFSFRLADEESLREFSRAAETYLLHHLERGFPSLENYKLMQGSTHLEIKR